jgi:plastocyanin
MALKLAGFAAGLMFLAACGSSTAPAGGGGGGCTPTATKICMAGLSFSPSALTVAAGTSVTWENGSNTTHTVTSATGSTLAYDSGNIGVGSVFSQKFNTPGTYHYYCKFHGLDGNPPSGMAGTITVQ